MSDAKTINRKTFLSYVATIATGTLAGCGDDQDEGGASNTGGAGGSGGRGGASGSGGATSGGGTTSTGGHPGTGGRANTGGASSDGDGGTPNMGGALPSGGTDGDGGMGGAMEGGGTGGADGDVYLCSTDTDNGSHSHPLTVLSSDVQMGYQSAPYVLEDGGTGHTHTLVFSAYEFYYLQAGVTIQVNSSEEEGHTHPCRVTCI